MLVFPAFLAGFFIFSAGASSDIYINELLIEGPSGEEFIELYNPTDSDISLKNYYLDYYSSGRDWNNPYRNKKFPDSAIIKSKNYFLIAMKTGEFSNADWNLGYSSHQLSDSNGSIALFPSGTFAESNALDSISWGKVDYVGKGKEFDPPKDGKSYEKKISGWQESVAPGGTPGKENSAWMIISAGTEPDASAGIEIKKDKNIFADVYASFEVNYAGATSATKYTWNFGDGHKSYKQKTTHKYDSAGTYSASITIRGDKSAKKYFSVEVEDYDAPKVKIIRLSPNPKGKDTGNEWIEIENNSKKKVNLKDWTIATGWEKLVNHKITKKFILKAKGIKKLTRDYCAFYLNNSKMKLELRDPSGETVQKLKYNRKKDKMEEDEIFALTGKKWDWDKSQAGNENDNTSEKETVFKSDETLETPLLPSGEGGQGPGEGETDENTIDFQIPDSEIQANLGKFTPDISWTNKKQSRIQLISYGTTINMPAILDSQPQVAGVSTIKIIPPEEKHWAEQLTDGLWKNFNSLMNQTISYL